MTDTRTTRHTLRRWAAGKRITKAQLAELTRDGYITQLDDHHYATVKGTALLTGKDQQ